MKMNERGDRSAADAGLFDAAAIGELVGRSRATILRWHQRGLMPTPTRIGMAPFWTTRDLATIQRLAARIDEKRAPLVTVPKAKDGEA